MIATDFTAIDLGGRGGLSRVWRLLRGNRLLALTRSALSLVEGLIEAVILTAFARVALTAVNSGSDTVSITLLGEQTTSITLIVISILIAIRLVVGALGAVAQGHLQFRTITAIRSHVVGSYSRASWRAQSEIDEGSLQQLLVTLPNSASGALSGLLTHFGHLLIMVAMLSYAMLTDPFLSLALIGAIIGASFAFLPLRRWIKTRSSRVIDMQTSLSSAASELSAMKFEVQAFGVGERVAQSLRDHIVLEGRLARRLSVAKSMTVPLYTTMTFAAVAGGLVILEGANADGLDDVGPILLVVLRSLAYGQGIQQAAIAIASLIPILDFLKGQIDSFASGRVEWGRRPIAAIDRIELNRVSYGYSVSDGPVLHDISATISRGERIGIVGPSGGGKSTLVRLVLGLVHADTGCVLVNQFPIHEHDRALWSERIGVVPQTSQLLQGSLADNLRIYRDGICDDELWWALEVADLASDVRAMPDTLMTPIGSNGRTLSGGQQQRLAIARALVTRPNLIVMDEPTSSIDALSEAAVSDAIERLPNDITILIVSHRMRILQGCDRLIVVEGGRITADEPRRDAIASSTYLASIHN